MIGATDRQRGMALATKANALNPDAAFGWYHSTMYTAYYLNGDYGRALELARQNPDQSTSTYMENIPIYGQLGRKQEALEEWRKLLEEEPGASAESFETRWRMWNLREEDVAKLMDGVYKSGVLGAEANPGSQPAPGLAWSAPLQLLARFGTGPALASPVLNPP